MKTDVYKTIEDIVRVELTPSAAAKGVFPLFRDNKN